MSWLTVALLTLLAFLLFLLMLESGAPKNLVLKIFDHLKGHDGHSKHLS